MNKVLIDLKIISNESALKGILTVFFNPGFQCVVIYRLAHFLYRLRLTVFSKILWYINRIIFSVDIDYRADLAGGVQIIHGVGIVIGAFVKTKGPIKIYQGVTIGGNSNKTDIREGIEYKQPLIGENTTIYANATVIGPIVIGDSVVIGTGSVITKNINSKHRVYSKHDLVVEPLNNDQ